ncbi:hypothetical protein SUGI_0777220 [Cryptomeria japonica]|nr:hypothetical protein SUGI_0777220 [Cryptomeria japonica]
MISLSAPSIKKIVNDCRHFITYVEIWNVLKLCAFALFNDKFSGAIPNGGRIKGFYSKSSVNYEYILLGYDELPVLKGTTPIQFYAYFMRSFKESFQDLHGETIVVSNCHIS